MMHRISRSRSLLAPALALLTAATLAACSSSSHNADPSKTTTTKPGSTTVKPVNVKCDSWLPHSAVTALFGSPAQAEVSRSSSPGAKTCVYQYNSPNYVKSLDVSVTPGLAAYGCRILPNGVPVTDFGPIGCVARHSITNALIIQFVKDNKTYSVLYNFGGLRGNKFDPSSQADQLVNLVKAAEAKIS